MQGPDLLSVLKVVVDTFDELGIGYYIGGSVASSAFGVPRATLDADLVAKMSPGLADELASRLEGKFYLDRNALAEAIRREGSFNLVHFETMVKVDLFVLKSHPYHQEAFRRAKWEPLEEGEAKLFRLCSPEDLVLMKLLWFKEGGCVSERQWRDVAGIIKVQGGCLDAAYLRRWAPGLELQDLLERALDEGGWK